MSITTNKELKEMSDFFLKTLFDKIPKIDVRFGKTEKCYMGTTEFVKGDDYDPVEDELYDQYEYKFKNRRLMPGVYAPSDNDPSFLDPLNKPKTVVVISNLIKGNDLKVVGTLLHELTHYWCFYCGYDARDKDEQFKDKIRELNLPLNSATFDYAVLQGYLDMWDEYKKEIRK